MVLLPIAAGVRSGARIVGGSGRGLLRTYDGEVARASRAPWPRRYARRLLVSDAAAIAVALASYAWIVLPQATTSVVWQLSTSIPYWLALCVVGGCWLLALDVMDTRDEHMVGQGALEYQRIVRASLALFATIVAISFFFRIELARSIFFIAIPMGTVLILVSRWAWRQWLRARQRGGTYVHRAVVFGELAKATHIARTIRSTPGTGYGIVGTVTTTSAVSDGTGAAAGGSFDEVARVVETLKADTVIFAGADDVSPHALRRLGWAMADRDISWVVAPALTDIAGPRIHARPVAGLPLIHISYPVMEGSRRFVKRTTDIIGSALLLIVLAPVMLTAAAAIRLDTKGPVLYRQERIGRRGDRFGMLKFRSMVADADDQLASLLDVQGTTDKPLFKVTNDPRITKVGLFIRKHSIDELPQLFNVLLGQMSLVGPRPQRAAEVALYDDDAHRRLLVKPGMSGLWQVSGRSTLSWDDAVRFDLYYVENWSFTQDMQILFRTIRAVVAPGETAS